MILFPNLFVYFHLFFRKLVRRNISYVFKRIEQSKIGAVVFENWMFAIMYGYIGVRLW